MKQSPLAKSCYSLLKKVPKGRVTTYKELAHALNTIAYRAIGQILKKNPSKKTIPCYKVIKNNGEIGGYCGSSSKNIKKKIALLKKDNISIKNNEIDLDNYIYKFDNN